MLSDIKIHMKRTKTKKTTKRLGNNTQFIGTVASE